MVRPFRRVDWDDSLGEWRVSDSGGFHTSAEYLAHAVARQLDTDDPLPCPHDGETVELVSWEMHRADKRCADCGEVLREGWWVG